jgi:phage replication-related protein YjqB (UPF0714/DUF867 family)
VADDSDRFSARDPDNIVNRLAPASGGLQVEQSLRVRQLMFEDIATAVASAHEAVLAVGSR